MVEIVRSDEFADWLANLRDARAAAKIAVRIERLAGGNPGDAKAVGDGISELRIDYGPGYRVYFTWHGRTLVILLWGGDKASQRRDIAKAKVIAARWK